LGGPLHAVFGYVTKALYLTWQQNGLV